MPTYSDNPLVLQASALVEQRTGLAVSAQFRANLEAILIDIAQGDLARLVETLQRTPETAPVWQRLIHTLAIGETYFFRHQPYFELLKNYILPDLIPQRRRHNPPRLNVWSAGCATGEEAYSIAITLREYLPDIERWALQVIGTDVNTYALQAARKGVYRRWSFRHTSPDFQARYFAVTPGGLALEPAVRQMVSFRHGNLLEAPPLPRFDIIFCCNVLLYFQPGAIQQVENRLYEALAPGGWLIMGQAEMLRYDRDRWTTHVFPEVVAYQKPALPGALIQRHARPLPQTSPAAPSPPPPGYDDAVRALRARDYDEADYLLSGIVEQNPAYAPAYALLGCLCANRHAIPEASMHLDMALRLDPLLADAHYLKGLLHLESQQVDAARQSLRAALYCQRGHTLAATILGHLYSQSGEIERARRTWEEALQVLDTAAPDAPISDVSDLTASNARAFLGSQIRHLGE